MSEIKLPPLPAPEIRSHQTSPVRIDTICTYSERQLEAYAREAVRLNACESRASTHAEGCWNWGPAHYGCAVREIEQLRTEIEALRAEVERLNRILGRIVAGDGDSTLAIRVGADAFAAAREYLRPNTRIKPRRRRRLE